MGNTCNCIDSKKENGEVNISSIQNDGEFNNEEKVEVRSKGAVHNAKVPSGLPVEQSEVNMIVHHLESTKYFP